MTRVLNGSFGAQLLYNVGARVIRVEPPGHDGDTRTFGPYVDGQSLYYSLINHDKESVVLDLKNDHDRNIFMNMLKQADALAEDFCPGTMEKLEFPQETLQEINPRPIYALSSGSGHTGPLKNAPAYDTIIQAMSRVIMEARHPDAPPVYVGTSFADLCGGVYLFSGIMSTLYGREKNQRGAHVDIAMSGATLSFLGHGLMAYVATEKLPQRLGNRHPYMAPFGVFNTQDKPTAIRCGNDKLLSTLYQVLELTELVDNPRFSSNILRVQNQAILKQYIGRTLKTQAAEVWLARIRKVGVPVAPLLGMAEAIRLPQTQARDMLIEAGGIMMPGNPIKISDCADPYVIPGAAALDQHGEQIRQEFPS